MTEIVFDQSAAGSLKAAKSVGKHTPPEGGVGDVFDLGLAHSMGGIAPQFAGPDRLELLRQLYAATGREGDARREMSGWQCRWEAVGQRLAAGGPVRLWVSGCPDDRCGLCWLLAQVSRMQLSPELWVVPLPAWEQQGDAVVQYSGWGEVPPELWGRYARCQQRLPAELVTAADVHWRQLEEENAPLRAAVNGRLVSVPADFYDPFIRRELAACPREFQEAALIGRIMGGYRLGIGDGWLALRIQAMVDDGELAVIQPDESGSGYRRVLCRL